MRWRDAYALLVFLLVVDALLPLEVDDLVFFLLLVVDALVLLEVDALVLVVALVVGDQLVDVLVVDVLVVVDPVVAWVAGGPHSWVLSWTPRVGRTLALARGRDPHVLSWQWDPGPALALQVHPTSHKSLVTLTATHNNPAQPVFSESLKNDEEQRSQQRELDGSNVVAAGSRKQPLD